MHSEYEFSSVAAADRRGFPALLVVMLGFTFFSASMWAGATLGNGLRAPAFLLAVLAGNLLLGALLLLGLMAYDVSPGWAALAGGTLTLVLRLAAIRFRWRLPVFRARA